MSGLLHKTQELKKITLSEHISTRQSKQGLYIEIVCEVLFRKRGDKLYIENKGTSTFVYDVFPLFSF